LYSRIFRDLVNLRELNFNAVFRKIPCDAFQNLVNVEKMKLKDCEISEIEPGAFSYLGKLKFLDLSWNKLKKCPSIEGLINLEHLDLYKNEIDLIGDVFIQPHFKLTMLNLRRNSLKSLPVNIFAGLVTLRSLNLARNYLNGVKLTGLSNLKELDLSGNPIKVLGSDQFQESPGLRKLFLANTKLESIEPNAFSHFRNPPLVLLDEEEQNYALIKPFKAKKLVDVFLNPELETNDDDDPEL
jgi:Leucine-rich repeat (LRR) protein